MTNLIKIFGSFYAIRTDDIKQTKITILDPGDDKTDIQLKNLESTF